METPTLSSAEVSPADPTLGPDSLLYYYGLTPEAKLIETGVTDDRYHQVEIKETVLAILRALPSDQRNILAELYLLDQSVEEVAYNLDTSKKIIKKEKYHALGAARTEAERIGVFGRLFQL